MLLSLVTFWSAERSTEQMATQSPLILYPDTFPVYPPLGQGIDKRDKESYDADVRVMDKRLKAEHTAEPA
jgi:hypothetical protein